MGINIRRLYMITFGIGAACAGVSGAAITLSFLSIPMWMALCHHAFVVVVLGGMGNVLGPL